MYWKRITGPHFSPLFFLPSFCMTRFCVSEPWFSSSALFCLFCVQNLCDPKSLIILETWPYHLILHYSVFFLKLYLLYLSLSVLCFLRFTYHNLLALYHRTAVTHECCLKPVKLSYFLDINTITFSFFHHGLGLLNGLGFFSIFYMVCLGLFFLQCDNGWWPSGTSLLHPFILLSSSYFYCL